MNDRELLELAAKAAGIEYLGYQPECSYRVTGIGDTGAPLLESWNPLTDDGDALRLAVKLGKAIEFYFYKGAVIAKYQTRDGVGYKWLKEDAEDDPYAATRRAIVRAAAEIGKEMK